MTVTGMTVTGMTKSMQTHTYFAFWRQKLENVYTTILMSIILFQCLYFVLFAAFYFYRKVGNRDDRLPVLLTT